MEGVICGIHNNMRKPIDGLAKKLILGIWFNVVKVAHVVEEIGIDVSSVFQIHVGSQLFLPLIRKKLCYIKERILNNRFVWAWKRIPSSYIEIEELRGLRGCTN